MKREPQTNSTKDRLVAWLKKVGKRLLAFLQDAWQRFKKKLKQVWHRYQLTRWLIVVFLSLFLLMSIHLTFVAKTSDVKNLQNRLSRPTMIYDNKKQSAGSLYSQKGTYVKLNNISSSVPDAVLSTEDRNFYHEHGFSVKGLGRAAFLLVKNKVLHRDYISGGGSTLTQQLVKNAFLTQQQTFSRKAREIFIAIEVENQYSKNEILTMYLNNAYFGHGVWGVQDAARRYFDVNASQLTVPQAATLAGMLTSPGIYDPIDHPEATRERRNMVLQLMVENKKLSQSDANAYKKTSLGINSGYVANDSYKYPYFFDAVISEAASRYNISEKSIMNDGYKIYTTLDQDQRLVRFVNHQQVVLREEVQQGVRWFAWFPAVHVTGIVFNPVGITHLPHHLDVVGCPLLEAFCFQQLSLVGKLLDLFFHILLDFRQGYVHNVLVGHEVGGREDRNFLPVALHFAGQGVDFPDPVNFIPKELNPECGFTVGSRKDFHHVTVYPEPAPLEVNVVPVVLDGH